MRTPVSPSTGGSVGLATPLATVRCRDDVARLEREARDHCATRVRLGCGPDCDPGSEVLAALVAAVRRLAEEGTVVVLMAPSEQVARTMSLCGLDGHVARCPGSPPRREEPS